MGIVRLQYSMSVALDSDPEHNDQQIKQLLLGIQNLTTQMNNTFEQAILKHEEQFIKTYRIKITELTKLFEDLTKVLEDKFINNALTNRLNIVIKERDYFKYQCLKLNVQYQTALAEQSGLAQQICNVTDQMKIYKHLLEDEKIKSKELEKNAEKFKMNFNDMAYRTLNQSVENGENRMVVDHRIQEKKNRKLELVQAELQEKNEHIRNLKMKVSELELVVSDRQVKYFERKELYETFKACIGSWKRDVLTQERKNTGSSCGERRGVWNAEKLTVASKKELLRYFFTSDEFLKFVEKLLFDPSFKVEFTETTPEGERFMIENRVKLFEYMRKKKIICSPILIQR